MAFYREILLRGRRSLVLSPRNTYPKRRPDDDFDSPDEDEDSDHSEPPSPQLPPPPPPPPSTVTVISSVSATQSLTVLPDFLSSLESTTFSTFTIPSSSSQGGQPSPPAIATISVTTTRAISVTTNSSGPTLPPRPSNLSHSKADDRPETKAVQAVLAIAVIFLFVAICYALFRLCPPVHSRWLGFIGHRAERRHKGMARGDLSPAEAPSAVMDTVRPEESGGVTAGARLSATTRHLGIVTNAEGGAGPRPPSYRTAFTASGASWVANGFRLPERFSQRVRRSRLWFGQSDGPAQSSRASESVRASLSARLSSGARLSSMSSRNQRVTGYPGFGETVHREMSGYIGVAESQQSVSEMHNHHSMCESQLSEVSRMSLRWVEQRKSSSLAPPPTLTISGSVTGDSEAGLTVPERMRQEPN